MDREAKDPEGGKQSDRRGRGAEEDTGRSFGDFADTVKISGKDGAHASIPLHLSAPEYVFLLVHEDREVLVLALLDGIRPGGDGPHLVKLNTERGEIFR